MKERISHGFTSPKGSRETMVDAREEAKKARNEGGICSGSINVERPTRADVVTAGVPRLVVLGLFSRKERWGFSWKGRLLVLLLLIGLATWFVHGVHAFFAVTHRVGTDVLVVEGWVRQYAIRAAINEFKAGHYRRVFTTGGPIVGMGGYINDYNTSASLGAGRLRAEGLSPDLIQMVPSRVSDRDRTYSAARALRDWFSENHVIVHGLNVVTEDVHARRSRLLFQEAFGPGVKVGIVAVPNPDYDARHWWRYSEGVREIIGESIAYIYAKLLFYPSTSLEQEKVREPPKASR
jgi:uncharacterized SAM-binding protein YcdF (DUF218 family)